MPSDTTRHTFIVSLVLCLVCSFLVSGAAVVLRDLQEGNKADSQRRNILTVILLTRRDWYQRTHTRAHETGPRAGRAGLGTVAARTPTTFKNPKAKAFGKNFRRCAASVVV